MFLVTVDSAPLHDNFSQPKRRRKRNARDVWPHALSISASGEFTVRVAIPAGITTPDADRWFAHGAVSVSRASTYASISEIILSMVWRRDR